MNELRSAIVAVAACLCLTPLHAQVSGPAAGSGTTSPPVSVAQHRGQYLETPPGKKPRVVITADPELDDRNSMIRYVLHATDYTTEGLIYASSMYHWKGDGTGKTQNLPFRQYNRNGKDLCPCTDWRWSQDERFIDDVVDAYEQAYPNLVVHNPDYPAPAEMRSKIKWGNVAFEGEMEKDTDGSNLIKALLLDDINEPIYLHAWGGQSTINRALRSIEEQYRDTPQWPSIRAKVVAKAVIHPSGDQDETGYTYLRLNWPDIRYGSGGGASAPLGYGAQRNASPEDRIYYSAGWMQDNVLSKGPLGGLMRVWGDGRRMVDNDVFDYFHLSGLSPEQLWAKGYDVWSPIEAKGEFLAEGDTGTFLSVLGNGLEGWRQENRRNPLTYSVAATITQRNPLAVPPPVGAPAWVMALRAARSRATGAGGGAFGGFGAGPQLPSRFVKPLMNDLAARLDWATSPKFEDANHHPVIRVRKARITARPGQLVTMFAAVTDPDQDEVAVKWWRFENNGTYAGAVTMDQDAGLTASFRVPADAKRGDTIHIVAEAEDQGNGVPLTSFARTVITIQ